MIEPKLWLVFPCSCTGKPHKDHRIPTSVEIAVDLGWLTEQEANILSGPKEDRHAADR